MTIKELDEQISVLKRERQRLEREEAARFQEHAKQDIGRCFKANNRYVMILDVPQLVEQKIGPGFNRYLYPALFLGFDPDAWGEKYHVPFYIDSLHAGREGDFSAYREIPIEEFNAEFETQVSKLRNLVLSAQKGKEVKAQGTLIKSDLTYSMELESARHNHNAVPAERWPEYFDEVFDLLRRYEDNAWKI